MSLNVYRRSILYSNISVCNLVDHNVNIKKRSYYAVFAANILWNFNSPLLLLRQYYHSHRSFFESLLWISDIKFSSYCTATLLLQSLFFRPQPIGAESRGGPWAWRVSESSWVRPPSSLRMEDVSPVLVLLVSTSIILPLCPRTTLPPPLPPCPPLGRVPSGDRLPAPHREGAQTFGRFWAPWPLLEGANGLRRQWRRREEEGGGAPVEWSKSSIL
jgi:hypothetical protein